MEDLERLYRERFAGFRAALATVTGSYDTARDAAQEGFARALANTYRPRRAIDPYEEAASIRLYSGREARIEQARGEGGTLCWRVVWGGTQAGGCNPLPDDALPSMMGSGTGENQLLLLHGPVGSRIARVDLIWDSGDRERLTIQNGFVLKQIDPNGTRWPARIVGRDEGGRVVLERPAFGPG